MDKTIRYILTAGTGLLALIVYLTTLAPSVVQIDSGELTAAQLTLGICHPTGYPLFSMVGYLFGKLPLGLRPVYQMNLLASLWCVGAVIVFVLFSMMILEFINIAPQQTADESEGKKKAKKIRRAKFESRISLPKFDYLPASVIYLASVIGGLILAFNKTFWSQSTSVEVYSLQAFLFCVMIFALMKAYIATVTEQKGYERRWIYFALALAFGFSNHMSTLFIIPGTAFLFFISLRFQKNTFILLAKMLGVFFVLLIALYAFLPIRAAQNPSINWGNPIDMERIIRHVSGKQYQVWLFTSFDSAGKQLSYFFSNFLSEFTFGTIIVILGFAFTKFSRSAHRIMIFAAITALFTLFYSINYDINDIDSYFLLTYISLSLFAVFGIVAAWRMLKEYIPQYRTFLLSAGGIAAVLFAVHIVLTRPVVTQNDTYVYEDYTRAILNSTPKNGLIMSYLWDYFVSPAYYLQKVENVRADVSIVDKELLRRSWYFVQMKENYPVVLKGLDQDIENFLGQLTLFEREQQYDPQLIEEYYQAVMTNMAGNNVLDHPVYISSELVEIEMQNGQFKLPAGYEIIPDVLLYRLVRTDSTGRSPYVPAPDPNFSVRFPKQENSYTETTHKLISGALQRRAVYELAFGNRERAKVYIKKVRSLFPDEVLSDDLKGYE